MIHQETLISFIGESLDSGTTFPNVIKNLSSNGEDSEFSSNSSIR